MVNVWRCFKKDKIQKTQPKQSSQDFNVQIESICSIRAVTA